MENLEDKKKYTPTMVLAIFSFITLSVFIKSFDTGHLLRIIFAGISFLIFLTLLIVAVKRNIKAG
ncbi:MAG: hypothetical protein ABSC53_09670 [Bacteroidota bacterium]